METNVNGDRAPIAADEHQVVAIRNAPIRLVRFSLRTMMIGVTLLCVWFAIVSNKANRQKSAVASIKRAGGVAVYDYQDIGNDLTKLTHPPRPPGPDWLRELIGIDYLASVVEVAFENIDYGAGTNDDAFKVLRDLPELKALTLKGPGIADSRFAYVKELSQLQELTVLDSSISDVGWGPLRRLVRLRKLKLYGLNVTDSAMNAIEPLTGLTELELDYTQISDSGLGKLVGLVRLEELTVSSAQITDNAMQSVERLQRLKTIRVNSSRLSPPFINDLQRAFPNAVVSDDFGPDRF